MQINTGIGYIYLRMNITKTDKQQTNSKYYHITIPTPITISSHSITSLMNVFL